MRHLACLFLAAMALAGCRNAPEGESSGNHSSAAAPTPLTAPKRDGNGPFGIDLSASPDALGASAIEGQEDKGLFSLAHPPRPSSDFVDYYLVAFDDAGICEIRAVSADFDGDTLGGTVRATADRLAEALSSKYGKAKHSDFCGAGQVACEPQFWSMAVMNGEREYRYEWSPGTADPAVRTILLSVQAGQFAEPYLRIDYLVNDAGKCANAATKARANNL
ncbi:MAG: hypothetical protein ACOY45_10265 [Pseudomonadota bacterium]